MVFFAGLPGTGKSLLAHQLAHLAHARGRTVDLLQWDVARPAMEASDAGTRYPPREGVTHGVIRMAAGLWARAAIAEWAAAGPEHLLIGETPLVGHRFIELARPANDPVEGLLSAPECRFVIPVPSHTVRDFLETERERRIAQPLHAREREDAAPQVLRDLWSALPRVAELLGIPFGAPDTEEAALQARPSPGTVPYDPVVYRRVYEAVLRHRHTESVCLDVILPTGAFSVYDFTVPRTDLVPTPAEAEKFIREVEGRFPDADVLEREIGRWWVA